MELTERIAFVREALKAGRDRAAVHAAYVDMYGPDDASPRTVDEYLRRVNEGWLRDAEAAAPNERARFLASLETDLATYAKAKAWGAHAGARRLQARVLGLDVQTVDVRGSLAITAARAPAPDEPLSDHEVALLEEALVEERARRALPAPDDSTNRALPGLDSSGRTFPGPEGSP